MKYVAYDYEETGRCDAHWHIYSTDAEPLGVYMGPTLLTIEGPESEEMRKAIEGICTAVDAAINLAETR